MRIIGLENVVEELRKGNVITKAKIYSPVNKWRQYVLLNDVYVNLTNGLTIKIPAGFQWDLSSVPRLLWPVLPPDGDHEIAALIHDYLYRTRYKAEEWGDFQARKFADKEMFIWSRKCNKLYVDNKLRYWGVRAFGGITFKKKN